MICPPAQAGPSRTRYAPSPTGYLHLGHVVNAVYVWGAAGTGGDVRLRLEDHDRIRCRPEYERAALEDIDWLGFVPTSGRHPPARQSDAGPRYHDALATLRQRFPVYACACSRRDIRERMGSASDERYDGYCRSRGLPDTPGTGLRVEIAPGEVQWEDLRLGFQSQTPAEQCGDVLLRDRDGNWTYQFAAVVDDYDEQIDLIIRGEDLLSSTGRQILLARMLGRTDMPRFLHHPLVHGRSGAKLSKSNQDTGVRALRARGLSAPEVIGLAAHAVGLVDRPIEIPAGRVADLFRG